MSRALATDTVTAAQAGLSDLDGARLPRHVAVIMDGNGRWAKQRNLPRVMGHREGVEALKRTLRLCSDLGIGALTAYAFSTENWSRPGEEVSFLMTLFERVLARELHALEQEQVRIRFLGDLEPLPPGLQRLIADATERTFGGGWLKAEPQLPGGAAHQVHLAGAVPDRRQGKALLPGQAGLHQLLQGLGGAQAGVGFAGADQHQMAAIGHLGQGGLEALG